MPDRIMKNSQFTIHDSRLRFLHFTLCIVNCALYIAGCSSNNEKQVTYADNIAPLIYKHCSTCHRPGSAGSFNLITYNDVKKHLKQVELVTRTRVMPPWPADFNYVNYAGENYL